MQKSGSAKPSYAAFVEEGAALAAIHPDAPLRKPVIVIGGGQAGLSVGYHLKQRGIDFVILDAARRIGDAWRNRWDSLRLFTPAAYDGLDGMPFPGPKSANPTKDQMADFLAAYAKRFALPVIGNTKVDRLSREGEGYLIEAGARRFRADQVIVAMSNYQVQRLPSFAKELSPDIRQVNALDYRNPGQLVPGDVLIVGAANSGAEIAKDISGRHRVFVAGPSTGEIPFAPTSFMRLRVLLPLLNRLVFPKIMSVYTPIGRKMRPVMMKRGVPLIRVNSKELKALGVERIGRVTGVKDGVPVVDGWRAIDVANVIWCCGFDPGLDWIDLPVIQPDGEPEHERGVVTRSPGLYFVGQHFLTAMSSAMVNGVGRDARRIVGIVAERTRI